MTTPTTLTFFRDIHANLRYAVSRCLPLFFTLLEESGEYQLNLAVASTVTTSGGVL